MCKPSNTIKFVDTDLQPFGECIVSSVLFCNTVYLTIITQTIVFVLLHNEHIL